MTSNKSIISNIPIREVFATPVLENEVLTNPTQLLIDADMRRFLALCTDIDDNTSDYELFAAFLENLWKMRGSGVYQIFRESLELFFYYKDDILSVDPKELWTSFCEIMSKSVFDINMLEKISVQKTLSHMLPMFCDNLSYEELISHNLGAIDELECDFVVVDLSSYNFIKTDRYHAEKAYISYIGGDKKSVDDVFSGLLYPMCEMIKKQGKKLYVYIGDNFTSAKLMIEYFSSRSILPETRIFTSGETLERVASELCGVWGKDNTRVRCGLVYRQGDTVEKISENIKRVAAVYPIGELFLGGSIGDSPAFAAKLRMLEVALNIAVKEI